MRLPDGFTAARVLHRIRHPITSYLLRRPMHPIAWYIYAWTLASDARFNEASTALQRCLRVMDSIAGNIDPDDYASRKSIESFSKSALNSLHKCELISSCILKKIAPISQTLATAYQSDFCEKSVLEEVLVDVFNDESTGVNLLDMRPKLIDAFCQKVDIANGDASILKLLLRIYDRGDPEDKSKVEDSVVALITKLLGREMQLQDENLGICLFPLLSLMENSLNNGDFLDLKAWYPRSALVAALDVADLKSIQGIFVRLLNEVKISRTDDDDFDGSANSSVIVDNAGDDRIPMLFAVIASHHFISNLFHGIPSSLREINSMMRSIMLAPNLSYTWAAFFQGSFANVALGSNFIVPNLAKLCSPIPKYDSFQEINHLLELHDILEQDGIAKAELKGVHYVDLLRKYSERILPQDLWIVFRILADTFSSAGKAMTSSLCYKLAKDEAAKLALNPLSLLSLELQALLNSCYQYIVSNNYDLLAEARDKIEGLSSSYRSVAAIPVLKACIWKLLNKPAKCSDAISEAKALWDRVSLVPPVADEYM